MTVNEQAKRLSDDLQRQFSTIEIVAICGSVIAEALATSPPAFKYAALAAHLETLSKVVRL